MTPCDLAAALEAQAQELLALAARLRAEPDVPPAPDRLLNADEVARRLDVPKSSVYALGREGQAGVVRIGHRMKFSERAFGQWLADRRGP